MGGSRGNQRGERGEYCPPDRAQRQNLARAKTIRKPAPWGLKQRIAGDESAKDPAQLDVVEMEFLLDGVAGDGNIHPVQIGDRTDREHPADQRPTHAIFQRVMHSCVYRRRCPSRPPFLTVSASTERAVRQKRD